MGELDNSTGETEVPGKERKEHVGDREMVLNKAICAAGLGLSWKTNKRVDYETSYAHCTNALLTSKIQCTSSRRGCGRWSLFLHSDEQRQHCPHSRVASHCPSGFGFRSLSWRLGPDRLGIPSSLTASQTTAARLQSSTNVEQIAFTESNVVTELPERVVRRRERISGGRRGELSRPHIDESSDGQSLCDFDMQVYLGCHHWCRHNASHSESPPHKLYGSSAVSHNPCELKSQRTQ